jgi:hypothetical protein
MECLIHPLPLLNMNPIVSPLRVAEVNLKSAMLVLGSWTVQGMCSDTMGLDWTFANHVTEIIDNHHIQQGLI